jgi:hypothetical protein
MRKLSSVSVGTPKYRTKFPRARLKKIMQTDEDIGKLSASVPVMVSKALELFLQSLIDGTCAETTKCSGDLLESGTVSHIVCEPYHLKKAIEASDKFDFLRDLVADIADTAPRMLKLLLQSMC